VPGVGWAGLCGEWVPQKKKKKKKEKKNEGQGNQKKRKGQRGVDTPHNASGVTPWIEGKTFGEAKKIQ